ncbi:uncharacterized protein LOC126901077 [Daktulosphaira vitifoliae]|uniref:uncharacterized protein LOC126901077 n=1 Tax=Daktulosphaira vitifoliae TaxID=58002 RepID=UPI0021AA89A2|nr:uncharacterized protein LOC126901077 [Daktulosphaira vitifoliae]XP_050533243.1 uncharacterized protein LOC126901077 [Daktulosphaira vitifoliae]XP_050533244.1 uncharacterized protein LOC126901077 [Daktulosphaira vitifoliae]XP_050533245.1 uncharacterized protein LOC126901077 [Daktulosphaira vitifoliae]
MESEPVIVVDQENCFVEEDEDTEEGGGGSPDTLPQDPFFLSPFRDMRKRSLPTPQCTTGITASQVRRLSDQGVAGTAAREKAFLATLTKAPGPYTPGRRHSVITISKAPMPLFGRNRRESIASFPSKGSRPARRDSTSGAAPSPTGSQFNLQLDIMDDIADIKAARKVRMKMWQTENKEKMCEVQPLDGSSNAQMSRFKEARRYSNIDVCEKLAPPIPPRRRASDSPGPTIKSQSSGIVCTNTDLMSIMNSLKSSANKALTKGRLGSKTTDSISAAGGRKESLRSGRSNSVDIANLQNNGTRNWFKKISTKSSTCRQPMDVECPESITVGSDYVQKSPVVVTFADERPKVSLLEPVSCKTEKPQAAQSVEKKTDIVLWDKPTGSVVNAEVLGTAIEGFLAAKNSGDSEENSHAEGEQPTSSKTATKTTNEQTTRTCDTSICSSLKDLFVK